MKLPSLFLSHGAPDLILHDLPIRDFLAGLGATLPRPRAVLVASAHYTASIAGVTAAGAPRTIHDFGGFDPSLYTMQYAAPGDPALAARIVALLEAARIPARLDEQWGFDHGAWIPLSLVYPTADLPVLELAVNPHAGAEYHLALGRALAPLRDEGVLVIGSGAMTHNLYEIAPPAGNDRAPPWVHAFADWVGLRLEAGDEAGLRDWLAGAPHARDNHPSTEHFLPLFVALGAAGASWQAARLHASVNYRALRMDAWRFDAAA
ncbi:MAG: dioxygenase [Gammaproteobacteria bacterium]|nr:dioxygenase [Gammaproteobacteria bacterium]